MSHAPFREKLSLQSDAPSVEQATTGGESHTGSASDDQSDFQSDRCGRTPR